jgi:hypothetical protein
VEKIKNVKVRCAILDCLHTMMFMSINIRETIESFKAWGRIRWWKPLIPSNPNNAWTKYFWVYYCQLGKQLAHFKPFAHILGFVDI